MYSSLCVYIASVMEEECCVSNKPWTHIFLGETETGGRSSLPTEVRSMSENPQLLRPASLPPPHTHILVHRLAAQEQERRDYELALRLAQDEMKPQQAMVESANKPSGAAVQSEIAHSSLQQSTAAHRLTQEQEAARKKYNLTKWKFAELRDTINTSCGKQIRVIKFKTACQGLTIDIVHVA